MQKKKAIFPTFSLAFCQFWLFRGFLLLWRPLTILTLRWPRGGVDATPQQVFPIFLRNGKSFFDKLNFTCRLILGTSVHENFQIGPHNFKTPCPIHFTILHILTTFNLSSDRPRVGLSVSNKQKVRQTMVKISRGWMASTHPPPPPPPPWPDMSAEMA